MCGDRCVGERLGGELLGCGFVVDDDTVWAGVTLSLGGLGRRFLAGVSTDLELVDHAGGLG